MDHFRWNNIHTYCKLYGNALLAIYLHNEIQASPLQIGLTIGIAPLISTVGGFLVAI